MRPRLLLSILLALGLVGASAAQTPTWKPELLGRADPSWSSVWAVAVNDAGVVVGNTYVSGWKHAWVASPTREPGLLPLPADATYSDVFDVNSSGIAVGQALLESGESRAVVWQPVGGGYDYLLLPPGPGGWTPFNATGINDRGDVVGKYGVLGGSYSWNEVEGVVQIPTSTFPKVPTDINEQRQIVADTYRMDLDTLVLENVGNPTGLTYGIMYTVLSTINDAGECTGYSVASTSSNWKYVPVRYTDGPVEPEWRVFSNIPLVSANATDIDAAGDTVFQLGTFGTFVWVDGVGSIAVQDTLDPAYAGWDLTDSFVPAISRGGLLATNGVDPGGQPGIVLLTPTAFETLGGASRGALGDPVLNGFGTLVSGEPTRLRLSSAAPDSLAYALVSGTSSPLPFHGGTLFAYPLVLIELFFTDALGRVDLTFDWPPSVVGTSIYVQYAVSDAAAATGVALSNAVLGVTQ